MWKRYMKLNKRNIELQKLKWIIFQVLGFLQLTIVYLPLGLKCDPQSKVIGFTFELFLNFLN